MAKKQIPLEWAELVREAQQVQKRAYAPYSKFQVGCAIEDEKGRIFAGCNVENASYPLAVCAERTAIVKMVSDGGRVVRRAVVITSSSEPCFPCGACRQVFAEFGSPTVLALDASATLFEELEFDVLLPYRFSGKQMG